MLRELSFLFLLAISSVCAVSLPRPWENQAWVAENPNVWSYGRDFWWNIPEFDKTLYSFDAASLSQLGTNGSTTRYLEKYEASIRKADFDRRACFLDVLGGIGIFPIDPSALFIRAFGSSSYCTSYEDDWKSAVDSSLGAAESSMFEGDRSLGMTRETYEHVLFLGICGGDYSGAGSQLCPEMESAFASIDQNVAEGDFGKHARIRAWSDSLKETLSKPVPDLSAAEDIIALTWGDDGLINRLKTLRSSMKLAESEAEAAYDTLKEEAGRNKALAERKMDGLRKRGASRITRAVESSYIAEPGSISQRFESLQAYGQSLEMGLEKAAMEHGRTGKQGYLAESVELMAETGDGYVDLLDHINALENDIPEVVEQQKSEAQSELDASEKTEALPSQDSLSTLGAAMKAFEEAESAETPGDAFVLYSKASALARSARSARNYSEEVGIVTALSSLSTAISRAEKDGIDVQAEKESLVLLKQLRSYDISHEINQSISTILSKARLKYEDDLRSRRERIIDKLSFAGPGAADLFTDLANIEDGLVQNGSINFPAALGSLAKLKSRYAKLESQVDSYAREIVGNSISISASPLITNVYLDEPAEISLDAVLSNPRPYNATNLTGKIFIPSPIDFLYSDITSGKDWIEGVLMQDGGRVIALSIPRFGAYETRRVIFSRHSVVAHTLKRESSAFGIGNGRAYVSENITFSLDAPINGLVFPRGLEGSTIDGSSDFRSLPSGKHTLFSSRLVDEAYSEKTSSIRSYRVGTDSHVEYAIIIEPRMDLDSVLLVIDCINDSSVRSMEISSGTGEPVSDKRRLSGTQLSVLVKSLKKGKNASILVSYDIVDTESFVKAHLADMRTANMSEKAGALLDEAEAQADAGNYTTALELMEKSAAQSAEESKAKEKMKAKSDSIRKAVTVELGELNRVLPFTNSTSPFVKRLTARSSELERLLNESDRQDSYVAVGLDSYDASWLSKELEQLKKDSYKSYNSLRERLYRTGDSSTPDVFISVEESLSSLESGNRLEYAISLIRDLENATAFVSARELSSNSTKATMLSALDGLKASVTNVLESYTKQAAEAKGTDYSASFMESEKTVTRLMQDARDSIEKDPRSFWQKIDELNKSGQRMSGTLDILKKEADNRISSLESYIRTSDFNEERKKALSEKTATIRKMISSGSYIAALRSEALLDKDLNDKPNSSDSNFLLLGATALAILGAVAFYAVRKEPKKKLRKLNSLDDSTVPSNTPEDSRSRK